MSAISIKVNFTVTQHKLLMNKFWYILIARWFSCSMFSKINEIIKLWLVLHETKKAFEVITMRKTICVVSLCIAHYVRLHNILLWFCCITICVWIAWCQFNNNFRTKIFLQNIHREPVWFNATTCTGSNRSAWRPHKILISDVLLVFFFCKFDCLFVLL